MKLDERHLAQLAAVVQHGSVTEGAASLHLTQPAVSRTIAALERRLGEPLFVRGRRPLRPTALGRALAAQGQGILAASRRASETVARHREGLAGLVRLGGTPFFVDALIATMLAGFHRTAPDVRVEQRYGYTGELVRQIRADELDVAVCPVDFVDERSGLAFRELLPGRNVVACGRDHPLVGRRRVAGAELLAHPWIAPPPGSPLFDDLRRMLLALGADEVAVRYAGGSLASVVGYLEASEALAILPHSVVFAHRRGGRITALPFEVEHPPRALGLLSPDAAAASPAVARLLDHLEGEFEALAHLIRRHERAVVWGD